MENQHHEKVLEIAVGTLERAAKNELEQDLPDEVHLVCRPYSYKCYQLLDRGIITKQYHFKKLFKKYL